MQITAELLDNEIKAAEAQLAQTQAHLNHITGALNVMRQLRAMLDKPDAQETGDSVELSDQGAS